MKHEQNVANESGATRLSSESSIELSEESIDTSATVDSSSCNEVSEDNRIEDLSTESLFIFKIHSPQVTKFWVGKNNQPSENYKTIQEVFDETNGTIVVNGSGYHPNRKLMGLQIKDSILYSGWANPNVTKYALESFVQMSDGSFRIYDLNTSPEEVVSEGGVNSFSFGQSLYKDSVPQKSTGTADWTEFETVIGSDSENNLYICVSKIETGFTFLQEALSSLNLKNALILDGGGSSQLMVEGNVLKPSDENRPLPEFIVID